MRFVFAALIFSVCGFVHGSDAGQPVSVLKHGEPTPAAPAAPTVATAPVTQEIVVSPVVIEKSRCRNGRCCVGANCRLYNVEEEVTESCRPRVLGGYVKKNTARTVYRPARR